MSRAPSSADPVVDTVGVDPVPGSAAALVGLGIGVWFAASFACAGGGGGCCVALPLWLFATAPWL